MTEREDAQVEAGARAVQAGLNDDAADAVVDRAMQRWHPDFGPAEWQRVVESEIRRQP